MKLEFTGDCHYNGELVHKKGEVKEIDNELGMASRWIRRGLAKEAAEVEVKAGFNRSKGPVASPQSKQALEKDKDQKQDNKEVVPQSQADEAGHDVL